MYYFILLILTTYAIFDTEAAPRVLALAANDAYDPYSRYDSSKYGYDSERTPYDYRQNSLGRLVVKNANNNVNDNQAAADNDNSADSANANAQFMTKERSNKRYEINGGYSTDGYSSAGYQSNHYNTDTDDNTTDTDSGTDSDGYDSDSGDERRRYY